MPSRRPTEDMSSSSSSSKRSASNKNWSKKAGGKSSEQTPGVVLELRNDDIAFTLTEYQVNRLKYSHTTVPIRRELFQSAIAYSCAKEKFPKMVTSKYTRHIYLVDDRYNSNIDGIEPFSSVTLDEPCLAIRESHARYVVFKQPKSVVVNRKSVEKRMKKIEQSLSKSLPKIGKYEMKPNSEDECYVTCIYDEGRGVYLFTDKYENTLFVKQSSLWSEEGDEDMDNVSDTENDSPSES